MTTSPTCASSGPPPHLGEHPAAGLSATEPATGGLARRLCRGAAARLFETDTGDTAGWAAAAALCELGYPRGFGIIDVVAGGPSAAKLRPGDEFVSVAGRAVSTRAQLNAVLTAAPAGRAVPVSFALGGDRGLAVLAGPPTSQQVACASGAPTGTVDQTSAAGASALRYDAASGRYAYTWKTDKAWAGTCRQLTLTLADYAATEKVSDLPRKLATAGAPAGTAASAGDITYYAPWGNLALFYRSFGYAAGLARLGRIDAGADAQHALRRPGPLTARIERAED